MVPHVATANWGLSEPNPAQRGEQEATQSRSWLARMIATEVRSATRSGWLLLPPF
jgi:hypothetical protein